MNCLPKLIAAITVATGMIAVLAGCKTTSSPDFLGSAVVEARTYSVSTTAQGSVTAVLKDEGQTVTKGELLAIIDTVPLVLARQEVVFGKAELNSSIAAQAAQIKALGSDVEGLKREYERSDGLLKKGSAPEQQRDNLKTQFQSAGMRLAASRHTAVSLKAKSDGLSVKQQEINDRISRCYVRSPSSGVVLTRYRNPGEVAPPGNPFFEIGAFDTVYADFFVPQPLLGSITSGQHVRIRIDNADGPKKSRADDYLPAMITWIGSEAEFSPKNIQTRQSRNELVFRVRATIPNVNKRLKRGLPIEVWR